VAPRRLPRAVVALGLTSLLTDISSEMILPLLPLFLASMQAGAPVLGLAEGAADATASFLKLGAGWFADRVPRKKPLVVAGYVLAAIARPLMALAALPAHVVGVRVLDRIGKGVRTAPRDAILAAAAPLGESGRVFGFHRAMDHAGAVIGPVIAAGLLAFGFGLREVFWAAAIPGALAVACVLAVREPPPEAAPASAQKGAQPAETLALPGRLRSFLVILFIFSLGNSSDAFLLLRARELGVRAEVIPLLWTVLHLSKVASSAIGGDLSDRMPRPRVITTGWIVYAASYVALGLAAEAWQAWAIFVVYGAYHGLSEPAEKALVRDLAPPAIRGRAFGFFHCVVGVAAIPAGLITGVLWERLSPLVALSTGAALAALAAILLAAWSACGGSLTDGASASG
jgi:MFS family permease